LTYGHRYKVMIRAMKKASIVSIGNELLSGRTDTNTSYLSGKLLAAGIPVVSSYTVGDDIDAIVRVLNLAYTDAEIILVTGGLGPTDDDLTRQAFANFLGVELQLQNEILHQIKSMFAMRNLEMPEKNKIQAYIPAGAKALTNNIGTAPGILAELNGKLLFTLPGVPPEMKKMFMESVLPELKHFSGTQAVAVRKLRCFGAGESAIAEKLNSVSHRDRNPLINFTAGHGIITLHIIATAENEEKACRMAEKDEKYIRNRLGELVYGTGEQTLAEVVGKELARQKKTIALAESCTGGIVAKMLTDIPGASEYFKYGWITYSNSAKINELDVSPDLVEKYGAVSEQVAEAMAKGARKKAEADFAIGITGIAGPTGGTEQKPVGLVYISVDSSDFNDTKRYLLSRNRQFTRLRAAQTALNMLRLKLNI
jgi:nicotinamide-nucleotide amidase